MLTTILRSDLLSEVTFFRFYFMDPEIGHFIRYILLFITYFYSGQTMKYFFIFSGVPVTYDRQSDVTGRILLLLLFVGLLMALSSRMKGMKSPLSMDSFVSL